MKQGGKTAGGGFTIVETMIVLAVSAALFVIAGTMISGRQAKTEFQVATRDIQTKLQQVVNETKSGFYGLNTSYTCSVNAPSSSLSFSAGGSLGTTGNCIFIGKALVIKDTALYIYPLVGARVIAGVTPADPKAAFATVVPNTVEKYSLPYGTRFVGSSNGSANVIYNGANAIKAFAIITSLGDTTVNDNGSQIFELRGFATSFNYGSSDFSGTINSEKTQGTAFPLITNGLTLCIQSGSTAQSVEYTIGSTTGGTNVTYKVKGDKCT